MTDLVLRNRQRTRPVNSPLLRRLTGVLLRDLLSLQHYQLDIHLVAALEMARVNQQFLDHAGSTDVITFDYAGEPASTFSHWFSPPAAQRAGSEVNRGAATASGVPLRKRLAATAGALKRAATQPPEAIHGEIFICIDDAVKQGRQFRTAWQSELVRYLVHGVLHLAGYDDLTSAGRRVMKREENRLLRLLSGQFSLRQLAKAGKQIVNRKS